MNALFHRTIALLALIATIATVAMTSAQASTEPKVRLWKPGDRVNSRVRVCRVDS